MARDMPVQDLRQAHLDHLSDEERHIVDPLCDDDQVTLPKDLLGLLRQLHSTPPPGWERIPNKPPRQNHHPKAAPGKKILVFLGGRGVFGNIQKINIKNT